VNNKYQPILDEAYGVFRSRRYIRTKLKIGRKGAIPVANRIVNSGIGDNDSDGEDVSVFDSTNGNDLYCDPTADEYPWNADSSGGRKSYVNPKQN